MNCGLNSDCDACAGHEKKTKIEAVVDGQNQGHLTDREGTKFQAE